MSSFLNLTIRPATEDDIPAVVELFAADEVGGHGDTTDAAALPDYIAAFERISASSHETLYVAELDGTVAGTFQTTITTSMTGRGSSSIIVEAVQTRADLRGRGIGAAMIAYAVEDAKKRGLRLVQLTSNKKRTDAHRFYERIGFAPSHLGFKMRLK
ncbi:GNAT family N-acetyltransferase [Oryzifoliimicrobium ureilyticus]|uniref:GNAT family N-acetyltransferase n=1 Tax=Oryzifoliimicrobium ureilyticus TaxID=3113724 RepID=UPI003076520A